MAKTDFGLKGAYISIVVWFLPAWAANTDYVVSMVQICTTVHEHTLNLTADMTIICVVHSFGVLKCASLRQNLSLGFPTK